MGPIQNFDSMNQKRECIAHENSLMKPIRYIGTMRTLIVILASAAPGQPDPAMEIEASDPTEFEIEK